MALYKCAYYYYYYYYYYYFFFLLLLLLLLLIRGWQREVQAAALRDSHVLFVCLVCSSVASAGGVLSRRHIDPCIQ